LLHMKKALVFSIAEDMQEIHSLLDTLDVETTKEFVQKRDRPHKVGFLGPGKIKDILDEVKETEYDWVVINGDLKPSQHHYIEMSFQHECVDRTGVILRIFSEHAHTPDAIAQVMLAKLRYEQPFLREWIHNAKSGERPGFMSGGAYATDVYYEHAKTHASRIEEELSELSKQREVRRGRRRASGYTLVSLAGYTNAGKSALMNAFSGSDVEVDKRLFSTLGTTTRTVRGIKGNALITDTVGFIKDLPTDLVNAFNSTLEEIFYADLILLVFDASEPTEVIKSKLTTSMDIVLKKIGSRPLLFIGNKADLIKKDVRQSLGETLRTVTEPYRLMFVSAKTGEGLDGIRSIIREVQGKTYVLQATVPNTNQSMSLLSRLHKTSDIEQEQTSKGLQVTVRCSPADVEKIKGWLLSSGATDIRGRDEADGTPVDD